MMGALSILCEIFLLPGSILSIAFGYTLSKANGDFSKTVLVGSATIFVTTFGSAVLAHSWKVLPTRQKYE